MTLLASWDDIRYRPLPTRWTSPHHGLASAHCGMQASKLLACRTNKCIPDMIPGLPSAEVVCATQLAAHGSQQVLSSGVFVESQIAKSFSREGTTTIGRNSPASR